MDQRYEWKQIESASILQVFDFRHLANFQLQELIPAIGAVLFRVLHENVCYQPVYKEYE